MPLLVLLWFTGTVWAGEFAVLASGSRLHVDGHETAGTRVTLRLRAGTVELDAAQLRGFEADDPVPAAGIAVAPLATPAAIPVSGPAQLADAAAQRYGLPPYLVRSLMQAESGFQAKAVSPKGAIGLMQLMPGTAESLGINPSDPAQNVDAGARYLRALLEKYGGGLRHALAAYNAGPAAVAKYGGVPPFAETVNYIRRVEKEWKAGE